MGEEVLPRRVDVLAQGVGDVGIDVVLRCARGIVRRSFLTVDRAPREQGSVLLQILGPAHRCRQHPVTEPQRVAGQTRRCVREERHHVDLGVPEVVAAVPRTADALGRDAHALRSASRLGELEEIPAHGLLQLGCPGISTSHRAQ